MSEAGRDCVAFLTHNFDVLSVYDSWARSRHPVEASWAEIYGLSRHGRRGKIADVRLNGLRKAGRLTPEAVFEVIAWERGLGLYPGFLTDPVRCYPEEKA